mmetsp:Transcript_36794/g.68436  ORF Transcript_36794/g.68436 Transcript_36794/m.68436 type:complete len:527 (-) Transcript_36794:67-1647(-)
MHRSRVNLCLKNFIGGTFREPASRKYLDNINPHTAGVINKVPASGVEDVRHAIAAASDAFPVWASVSAQERAGFLRRIADEIEKNSTEFALAESRDTGKPLTLSTNVDIDRGIHNFRFFADVLLAQGETSFEQQVPQQAHHHISRRPVGVAALISPWNLPLYLLSWKVAPALAAGCTVVAKPSEFTPTTASLLAEAAVRAGLPAGVLNVVHGLGQDVGEELVGNKAIKAVSFTGGTATGATVATVAAPHFKKISLELGGKNPAIVLPDADLDVAIKGVLRSSFLNSGQICLCSSRLLVHESIHDEFVSRLKAGVEALKVGDPLLPDTDLGPVVSRAHLNKIAKCVEQAVENGAQVMTGGPDKLDPSEAACFYPPTVLTGVQQHWDIVQEEVFGPVVTVQTFSSLGEALELANGVKYGLAATVWTSPDYDLATNTGNPRTKEVMDFTEQLDCGMIWVNCWLLRDLRVPFGGTKASGLGREGGGHSLDFFSEVSSICLAAPASVPPLPGSMRAGTNNRTTAKIASSTD